MAKIPEELAARIAKAKKDRNRRQAQINRYLRFADPTRPRIGDNHLTPIDRNEEVDDLFDTTLQEVAEDFASELIARVMPRETNWLTFEPEQDVPDEIKKEIDESLKARTASIFSSIRGSNFYDEAAGEWALDMGHGTGAVIITDPGMAQPFYCEAIPPGQLLIGRGARGVNFRGRECAWEIGEALAYWPHYDWPSELKRKGSSKTERCNVVPIVESAECIPDPGTERWKWRVVVADHLVYEVELTGRGSCPILASRWRTHSASAWGIGPLLKAVPDALTLDQERYLVLKNLGKVVDPPVTYDDDGVLNPEGGVGAGMWIPRLPGSKVEQLKPQGALEAAYYEQGGLQDSIRRAGFASGPRQRGKTPPTLGQWMDEKAEEGRRLEMPTGKLYAEGVVAVVERFEHLLVKRGEIAEVLSADKKAIRVRPLNPLSRQQDFEMVQVATQLLDAGQRAFGPQAMAAMVDGGATFENLKKRLNDEIVVVRDAAAADPLLRGVLGQPGQAPGLETVPPEGG